ncbi:TolC family protein [Photobacterium sp. 1_MG-2023]|uniref:TolC family protein n=1 Tax=Photobacterium sp. 1_MG-2023 TaxID=3062646 RepID=UPI0026E1CCC0|nr:TolC family protein [Photobacterium sp. 1_MG-2023]MDO6708953.1 TolC family protein [Photobacterium sp. 1_MG-2023]
MKKQLSMIVLSFSTLGLMSLPVMATGTVVSAVQPETQRVSLQTLIALALVNDASQKQLTAQSDALRETAIASATQMDPKLKFGVGGLPVDSFQFDEDPMTNISVGLMQQFERGDTLALQARKVRQQADGIDWQRLVRQRDVANQVTQLWLELGYQQTAERLLRDNRQLMSELAGFIETNYAIGTSEAQDLLKAQLQVTSLDDKIQANQQMQRKLTAQMSEWLGADWLAATSGLIVNDELSWQELDAMLAAERQSRHYFSFLNAHPLAKVADTAIAASETQAEIAGEAYQPQFGVEVMYGYRQANNMRGEPASDLLSAFLTVDLPLFTGNRQDRQQAAAQYQVGAAKSQKDLILAQMNARVNALVADRTNQQQRLVRYQSSLLPQAKARTQAVERGYQNNTAQFSEVILAASDALAIETELARLTTDLNQTNSNLAFLLGGRALQEIAPSLAAQPLSD